MSHYDYLKHVISKATNYTFNRMGFYLTIFNFFMLANWMYENTSLGDWMKDNGWRPGDALALILFSIFAISALEYVVIGRDKKGELEPELAPASAQAQAQAQVSTMDQYQVQGQYQSQYPGQNQYQYPGQYPGQGQIPNQIQGQVPGQGQYQSQSQNMGQSQSQGQEQK